MDVEPDANADQLALWNGAAGRGWVEMQEVLDTMFRPVERMLLDATAGDGAPRLLDVGCGTGGLVLAFARRDGPDADCTGIDISAPMIDLARSRAAHAGLPARFIVADAQGHAFERARYDTIVSRFGVMFFDDPVRAFSNLRYAASAGAKLDLIAWRSAAENPFMTVPEQAAAPLLPQLRPRNAEGPGQFAWADPARVRALLEASGWSDIQIDPVDFECVFSKAALPRYISWVGPVGRALQEADDETRGRVIDAVSGAVAPFMAGDEVRFTAACWSARGHASD